MNKYVLIGFIALFAGTGNVQAASTSALEQAQQLAGHEDVSQRALAALQCANLLHKHPEEVTALFELLSRDPEKKVKDSVQMMLHMLFARAERMAALDADIKARLEALKVDDGSVRRVL